MEKKYQRLWDRKTFACIGLSVALSTGLSLSLCAVKGATVAKPASHSVSDSRMGLPTSLAEGR